MRNRWSRMLLPLALVALLAAPGCSRPNAAEDLKAKNQQLEQRVAELERELAALRNRKETVTLYRIKSTPTDFWLVPELKEISRQPDMLKAALEELIKHPDLPIPKETKVIDVKVEDFIAYPNFSREITRLSVGSKGEALVVAAIANTLIKFPGVERVQILVEGRPAESLAGHVDISRPVGRNDEVLWLKDEPPAR